MNLICPNCGSTRIVYAGTSALSGGAYEATDQRYTCKNCGYSGPLVIDTSQKEGFVGSSFPSSLFLLLAILSVSFIALGIDFQVSALVFIIPAAIILFFYFLLRGSGSVEEDLKTLDEDGRPLDKIKKINQYNTK